MAKIGLESTFKKYTHRLIITVIWRRFRLMLSNVTEKVLLLKTALFMMLHKKMQSFILMVKQQSLFVDVLLSLLQEEILIVLPLKQIFPMCPPLLPC